MKKIKEYSIHILVSIMILLLGIIIQDNYRNKDGNLVIRAQQNLIISNIEKIHAKLDAHEKANENRFDSYQEGLSELKYQVAQFKDEFRKHIEVR